MSLSALILTVIEEFLRMSQFDGEKGEKMKEVYGEFCSKQMDAALLYKDLMKNDRKFSTFIKVYSHFCTCMHI